MTIEYPIKFNKCPACGSEERIAQNEAAESIERGELPVGTRIPFRRLQAVIFDPQTASQLIAPRQVPVLVAIEDICANCGKLCVVEVQKQMGVAMPDFQPPPKGNGR